MKQKKLILFFILTVVVGTCVFSQSLPPNPWKTTRAVIPDAAVFGFSTYVLAKSSISLGRGYSSTLGLPMVVSSSLLVASSGLQIANNLFVKDGRTHQQLLWATRAGYLAAFLTPIIWGLADPDIEGEDRVAMLSINITALVGFGLTFLPYPGRGN